MDWKKIDHNIKSFASELNSEIIEKEVGFMGGKITTYSFSENNSIGYTLRQAKPRSEFGSKFQIESGTKIKNIEVSVRKNIFGRVKIKYQGFVSPEIKNQMEILIKNIYQFKWSTEAINRDEFKLRFRTEDIEIDLETMHLIRSIHQALSK